MTCRRFENFRLPAIDACPEIEDGPGRLVTAVLRHWKGETWDLHVDGEPVPIVVTREHPFWSADRTAWVPAWRLRPGERLSAEDGPTPRLRGFSPRERPEPVSELRSGKKRSRISATATRT